MLISSGARRLWVCTRCVRRRVAASLPPPSRRCQSTAAASAAPPPLLDHGVSSRHDDAVLRELFDAPSSGRQPFAGFGLKKKSQGLFKNRYLTSPDGFLVFARRNLDKATALVRRVLAAKTTSEYQGLVRDLDRLSDLLCRVLDLSDFVRMTHPDPAFQQAAAHAWSMVYQYMNQLNTTTGLDDQLARALSLPDVTAAWSEEEAAVADLLKLDFTKSAVNLPKPDRDRFVDLSSRISDVGSAFVRDMEPRRRDLTLPSHRFYGLYPGLAAALKVRSDIKLATTGSEATAALQSVYDEDTRRDIYLAQRTASPRTIALLETMLRLRAELARLAGFDSYGHMALKDRMMAKSPAAVGEFLRALRAHNAPTVQRELRELTAKKRERLAMPDVRLQAWDRDFYMEKMRADMRSRGHAGAGQYHHHQHHQLAAYFSVGTVMQGLSRLFDRLYGVRFVPRDALPGETWHPDVKRLDIVSDAGEQLAVLYCDLFYRPQKSPNPAHFTVRCSREILAAEVAEAAADFQGAGADGIPAFDSPEQAANDGMETSTRDGTLKQLPTIALVCDFPKNDNAREPALLSYCSVETLFHEMGHAIHSILARTCFQNVSGTRCATDFAELPSTLMEHFAADPAVLGLFARHWKTDAPLPCDLVAERIRLARRFEGSDTEHQILLAMLDQAYHSPDVARPGFDSTAVFHDVHRRNAHGPHDPPETCWQGFFGHLHSYGSTYYSYLFDRVLAERVWRVVFRAGGSGGAALSRDAGERLKQNLLKWGGGRDPWRCLADTLADDRLAPGDDQSMALVGSWGIKDDKAPRPN
ncbi:peptidase family M3 domain-containing protein [Hirsutella rhossiliensis]|uniref:Mitochondrial intermediate peptidase n=1 Tax=Hirsutella rhossiliensis TaxID=111463 RepID=A0A9P8MXP3_9HYPO|nr:peptidase family m3 domain-containing protein [Hirsutella rhossiliensis]KAH0963135.1 peptidase family m3 domain-containing protein [Hirsutella rhossiliensis]